jgi:uncharacterized protein (UPF0276 family)
VRQLNSQDRVGLGWRDALAASIFSHLDAIEVVEVIADDYFDASARVLRSLRSLGTHVPVVLHGVTLGLASTVAVAVDRLDRLAKVVNALEPTMWSEHLAFVRGGSYEIGHLAAPPRNPRTVDGALRNIALARSVVGQTLALENIATLIDPPDSSMTEPDWVAGIAAGSGSALLLDLHNLYANAVNFGHDPCLYLQSFPLERVRLVHISGGRWIHFESVAHGVSARRLLDDHLHDVPDVVFSMLRILGERCAQPLTVILERDGSYPDFAVLLEQLLRARQALAAGRRSVVHLKEIDELATI